MRSAVKAENKIKMIPIYMISSPNVRPHRIFSRRELSTLQRSIEKNGIIQPITVRVKAKYDFELVLGERRLQAAVMAGLTKVPCIILHCTERQSAVYSLVENIQRESMNVFERADALKILIYELDFTKEEAARQLGVSKIKVDKYLKLTEVIPLLRRALQNEPLSSETLERIGSLDHDEQQQLIKEIAYTTINDNTINELIDDLVRVKPTVKRAVKDVRLLYNTIENAVAAISRSGINITCQRQDTYDRVYYQINIDKTKLK